MFKKNKILKSLWKPSKKFYLIASLFFLVLVASFTIVRAYIIDGCTLRNDQGTYLRRICDNILPQGHGGWPAGTVGVDVKVMDVCIDIGSSVEECLESKTYRVTNNNANDNYLVPFLQPKEFKSFAVATKLNTGNRLDNTGGTGVEICENNVSSGTCHDITHDGDTVQICGCNDLGCNIASSQGFPYCLSNDINATWDLSQ